MRRAEGKSDVGRCAVVHKDFVDRAMKDIKMSIQRIHMAIANGFRGFLNLHSNYFDNSVLICKYLLKNPLIFYYQNYRDIILLYKSLSNRNSNQLHLVLNINSWLVENKIIVLPRNIISAC
jgi:hypothetical protein